MPDNLSEKSSPFDFPLVSIVIPTRNRSALLGRALESVLKQEYHHLEVIVVDDASDDSTPALIDGYCGKFPIFEHIRNEVRCGGAESRNIGMQKANGKYIAFLDDDDEWLRKKIITQVKILENNPSIGAVACWFNRIYSGGIQKSRLIPEVDFETMLWENFIGSFSFCMVRSNIAKSAMLDPDLKSSQDWHFWLLLSRITKIYVVEDYLVNYYDNHKAKISRSYSNKFYGLRKMYFKYRDYMSEDCRRYRLTYLIAYKVFSLHNKNYISLAFKLFKKKYLFKNRISRFVLKKAFLHRFYKVLNKEENNLIWMTYRFIKKMN